MKGFLKVASAVLVLCIISILGVFAAPDTVSADATGNTYDLLVVTHPQNQKDSTFDSTYIVSGYGKEGTVVTLYWYDATDGVYKKVYNETQYVDENGATQTAYSEATVTIGASGLFMNSISLVQGTHNILVRAENGENVQVMKISLIKYSFNLFDILKSLTSR